MPPPTPPPSPPPPLFFHFVIPFGYLFFQHMFHGHGLIIKLYKILQMKSKNKHDWIPIRYLNILHHNRIQKQLLHFFLNMLQKYHQLSILGTLDLHDNFHQKPLCQLVETLTFICMQKLSPRPKLFFEM